MNNDKKYIMYGCLGITNIDKDETIAIDNDQPQYAYTNTGRKYGGYKFCRSGSLVEILNDSIWMMQNMLKALTESATYDSGNLADIYDDNEELDRNKEQYIKNIDKMKDYQ
jgi:hypothetical protein